jgi:hypothetical protein
MRTKPETIEVPRQRVLCQCICELVSRVQRPFLWRVTVQGKWPHNQTRVYEVSAAFEKLAADAAMKYFEQEMSSPQIMQIYTPTPWH